MLNLSRRSGPDKILFCAQKDGQQSNDGSQDEGLCICGIIGSDVVDVREEILEIQDLQIVDLGLVEGGALHDLVIEGFFKKIAAGPKERFRNHDIPVTAVDAEPLEPVDVVGAQQKETAAGEQFAPVLTVMFDGPGQDIGDLEVAVRMFFLVAESGEMGGELTVNESARSGVDFHFLFSDGLIVLYYTINFNSRQ